MEFDDMTSRVGLIGVIGKISVSWSGEWILIEYDDMTSKVGLIGDIGTISVSILLLSPLLTHAAGLI